MKQLGCSNPWCGGGKWCVHCRKALEDEEAKKAPEKPEEAPSRLEGKLEPEAKDGCSSLTEAATLSIAISLKRIADMMEADKVVVTGEVTPYNSVSDLFHGPGRRK